MAEGSREPAAVGREGEVDNDVRQPADPVPQPPARPVEEVDVLVGPRRARPPAGGNEGAIGGDSGGVGLADIAGAGGQA
jgi:hypothetical protein